MELYVLAGKYKNKVIKIACANTLKAEFLHSIKYLIKQLLKKIEICMISTHIHLDKPSRTDVKLI